MAKVKCTICKLPEKYNIHFGAIDNKSGFSFDLDGSTSAEVYKEIKKITKSERYDIVEWDFQGCSKEEMLLSCIEQKMIEVADSLGISKESARNILMGTWRFPSTEERINL